MNIFSRQLGTGLFCLLFVGSGCVSPPVSNLTPEEAASVLSFSVGDEFVLRPTVLGLGGSVVEWSGADEQERTVTLNQWIPNQKVDLTWKSLVPVETTESKAAREAYESEYAQSPVGVEIPEAPEPVYEQNLQTGTITSESLSAATTLMLPQQWPVGDGGMVEESLIWLSQTQYNELINTRSTKVSLGLFDESLSNVEEATTQAKTFIDQIGGFLSLLTGKDSQPTNQSEEATTKNTTTIKADPSWGIFTLEVDGVRTKVRVVEAKNAFAQYKILANPENPLILEIQLTPLSQGNLKIFSKESLAKGFAGYEISEINLKTGD
ncbi:MAG: hypothetical protein UT30_C0002G0025 [Candidatus Uhrbacteria bacterium GW2011_GWF2_39_13]|uniref:Uncharacterized protein n=1 Tax=Candidatus Uhrbacteria bacterium GW2011_GWF2_39_13 TaxID=1618995 RepID=A0A0G0MP52_9BACT|nr:MAG: hypothetical protein UT30_C0002G0025 [Candidatus Uhrbacteria bacterium GW2011_GWF2_39_13]HAU66113.1 hypothetical protein [Candidatus Uhrbacteria bacterium]